MTDSEKPDMIINKLDSLESIVENVKGKMKDLKFQQMKDTAELKAMDEAIFDEVERFMRLCLDVQTS